MSTAVKLFHSGMPGAPVLSGTAGTLLAVLQACLVDGWGSATVDSLVISGGIATVTIAAGNPFEVDSVALIAGAVTTGGSVNGERRVLTRSATGYTFAAPGLPDQTATGTITHKVAPLGWERVFTGTNKAAYRPTDATGTRMYLRVDDSGTLDARVVGYETMSDIDTGTGPFPTAAQVSGGAYFTKANGANATARKWVVLGDSRGFFYRAEPNPGTPTSWRLTQYFGDFLAVKSPDAYACMLAASARAYTATTAPAEDDLQYTQSPEVNTWVPRSYTGVGSAIRIRRSRLAINGNAGNGTSGSSSAVYPNPADNGLYVGPVYIGEADSLRGVVPGFYYSSQGIGLTGFADLERVTGVTGLPGKKFVALLSGTGVGFFDVLGPWR